MQKLNFALLATNIDTDTKVKGQQNVLARNSLDILVLPAAARQPQYLAQVAVITRATVGLADDLEALAPLSLDNSTGTETHFGDSGDADQVQPDQSLSLITKQARTWKIYWLDWATRLRRG